MTGRLTDTVSECAGGGGTTGRHPRQTWTKTNGAANAKGPRFHFPLATC